MLNDKLKVLYASNVYTFAFHPSIDVVLVIVEEFNTFIKLSLFNLLE